ncbi:MAG: hypothetical protein PUJ30_00105, partial [Bacteroidales bacterium]|nr:hypothetical protein [Bacteroidales bacterium]
VGQGSQDYGVFYKLRDKECSKGNAYVFNLIFSNPQKITCIIFKNLFGPYFLPPQSHSYGYAPSSGENLTSKMSFKSDATYFFHITYQIIFSPCFQELLNAPHRSSP